MFGDKSMSRRRYNLLTTPSFEIPVDVAVDVAVDVGVDVAVGSLSTHPPG
jgi:hypothetical protein